MLLSLPKFPQGWSNTSYLYLEVMMILTIYMNSFFNPLLYIIRNTKYRKEIALLKLELMAKFKFFQCDQGCSEAVRFTNASDLNSSRGESIQKVKVINKNSFKN